MCFRRGGGEGSSRQRAVRSLAGWLTAARGAEIRRLHPTVALFCPLTLLTLLYEGNVFVGSKRIANNKLASFYRY